MARGSVNAQILEVDPLTAARRLLGAVITCRGVQAAVVEVEAYGGPPTGPWPIPRPTPTAARLRATRSCSGRRDGSSYRSYGIHVCANISLWSLRCRGGRVAAGRVHPVRCHPRRWSRRGPPSG